MSTSCKLNDRLSRKTRPLGAGVPSLRNDSAAKMLHSSLGPWPVLWLAVATLEVPSYSLGMTKTVNWKDPPKTIVLGTINHSF